MAGSFLQASEADAPPDPRALLQPVGKAVDSLRERNLRDIVLERADSIDSNAYNIAARQREVTSGNDAGPGHQKHALGEAVVAEEEFD